MADGVSEHQNLLTIGFLNDQVRLTYGDILGFFTSTHWVLGHGSWLSVFCFSGGGEKRVIHQLLWHRAGEGRDAGRPQRHPQTHYLMWRQQVKRTGWNRTLMGNVHTDGLVHSILCAASWTIITYLKPDLKAGLFLNHCVYQRVFLTFSVYQSHPASKGLKESLVYAANITVETLFYSGKPMNHLN